MHNTAFYCSLFWNARNKQEVVYIYGYKLGAWDGYSTNLSKGPFILYWIELPERSEQKISCQLLFGREIYIFIYQNVSKSSQCALSHLVGLLSKSVMCIEVTLNQTIQEKIKWTSNGRVPDKIDKADSNWRRTIDVSPVRSISGLVHVKKWPTLLPNVNRRRTYTPNVNHIETNIDVF